MMTPNKDLSTSPQPRSLKSLALKGSAWTLGGYATAQIFRLISNVILAKLLFPEAFGLMTLVAIFMQGIAMFSDIGIIPSIIQNKRGDDPAFLNTAWTIQVIRGVLIWIVACIGAYPYSLIYNEPLLMYMIPVAGFSAVIAGFNSTSLALANRKLNLGKITLLELITQLISIAVMIGWVLVHPTVWGLVAGGLVSALIKMFLSHFWIEGIKNRLYWDKECALSLFRFGRWILGSTMLTFFAGQIDRLLMGAFMGTAALGVYSIAIMFKETASSAIQRLGSKVLFPSYSEIVRTNDHSRLYRTLKKTRLVIIASSWSVSIILIVLGSAMIDFLYDERYGNAVWMIQILPLSSLVGVLSLSYQNVLLAKGKSGFITAILAVQIIIQASAIMIGYYTNGIVGIIVGLTFVGWLMYPVNMIAVRKISLWQPEVDFPVILAAIAFVISYAYIMDVLF